MQLICSKHSEMEVIKVCFNEICLANRLLCEICVQNHSAHTDKLYDINTLEQKISPLIIENNKILNVYNTPIDNIIDNIHQLKKIMSIKQSTFIDHLNNEIEGFGKTCQLHNNHVLMICKKKKCRQDKYLCFECIENHKDHLKCLRDKQKVQLICNKMIEKINQIISFIANVLQELAQIKTKLNEKFQITIENFLLMNNENISNQITVLLKFTAKQQLGDQSTLQFFQLILQELYSIKIDQHEQSDQIREQQNIMENFENTIDLLGKCIESSQNHQYLSIHKGDILRQLNLYDQSLYWYDQILQKNNQCKEALFGKGIVLKQQKNYQESLEYFQKVLLIQSEHIEALCEKGDCLYNLNKYEQALDVYEKILEINFNEKQALCGKGNTLRMLDKCQLSIEWFNKALTINPQYESAILGKGQALMRMEKYQESIKLFDNALVINPKNEVTLVAKGQVLMMLGCHQDSIQYFRKAVVINQNCELALWGQGQALLMLGRLLPSIEWFNKALAINPKNEITLVGKEKLLGEALLMLGKKNQSIECFNQALAINPNYNMAIERKAQAESPTYIKWKP